MALILVELLCFRLSAQQQQSTLSTYALTLEDGGTDGQGHYRVGCLELVLHCTDTHTYVFPLPIALSLVQNKLSYSWV